MTRTTNARLAGFTFLLYIAVGITDMTLSGRATSGTGIAARLANIAEHATVIRVSAVLALVMALCALVLAATLYALTRDYDRDLALLASLCRVVEGANNSLAAVAKLQLLSVATAATRAAGADAGAANALGSMLLADSGMGSAILFAVGSTLYCYIFLRARTIPLALAWLGVLASVLLVIFLPLEMAGLFKAGWLLWMPMLAFELIFALWLMFKGVAPRADSMSREANAV